MDVKVTWIPRKLDMQAAVNQLDSYRSGARWILTPSGLCAGPGILDLGSQASSDIQAIFAPVGENGGGGELLLAVANGANQDWYRKNSSGAATLIVAVPVANAVDLFDERVLFGNSSYMTCASGVLNLNWFPASYTVLAGSANIVSLTQHSSRLVGIDQANDTVKWSVAGNFDDWVTTPSAGSANLALPLSTLTSVRTIRNQLVVLGSKSIHYGFLTGTTNPVYRFEQVMYGAGLDVCGNTLGVAEWNDTLFYSSGSVYRFEGGKQYNIGNPWLADYAKAASRLLHGSRGVISNGVGLSTTDGDELDFSAYYILAPTRTSVLAADVTNQAYAYDINKDIWIPLTGNRNSSGVYWNFHRAFQYESGNIGSAIYFLGSNLRNVYTLSAHTETMVAGSIITSPPMLVGDSLREYTAERMMIRYRSLESCICTVDGTCSQNGTSVAFTLVTKTLPAGVHQVWLDLLGSGQSNLTGQMFSFDLTFTTANPGNFILTEADVVFIDAGEYRGA